MSLYYRDGCFYDKNQNLLEIKTASVSFAVGAAQTLFSVAAGNKFRMLDIVVAHNGAGVVGFNSNMSRKCVVQSGAAGTTPLPSSERGRFNSEAVGDACKCDVVTATAYVSVTYVEYTP